MSDPSVVPPTAPGAPLPIPAFRPRPAQARILEYERGPMGISAVPGSGKTFILSLLAAQLVTCLIREEPISDDPGAAREVLVVTFTNSAVENFRSRIGRFLAQRGGALPGVGYRVRTLHGLAHDIVRERPGLVGLSDEFDIIDERTASELRRDAVLAFLRNNPEAFAAFIDPKRLQNYSSIEKYVQDDAIDIANSFIRMAKEFQLDPEDLAQRRAQTRGTWPLLDFGIYVYTEYQKALALRGAVDFNDLILLALRALAADPAYLARLRRRWPYVLEDEAQDSSALQEEMLRLISGEGGNWVRVGDPNQAINTTFTGADTRFLQRFVARHAEQARDLPNSGRSALPIIELANRLIEWSRASHPQLAEPEGEARALTPPLIEPTPEGDPQPNPDPGTPDITIYDRPLSPEQEVETVVTSLQRWLPANPNATVAVLVPENHHGFRLTEKLEEAGVEFDDSLLRTDAGTRAGAEALATVVSFLAQPDRIGMLSSLWAQVWWPQVGLRLMNEKLAGAQPGAGAAAPAPQRAVRRRKIVLPEPVKQFDNEIKRLREPELFLFPSGNNWLEGLTWLQEHPDLRSVIDQFQADVQRWSAATVLPIDELILTLGNELFRDPTDLALAHRLALLMNKLAHEHREYRLLELSTELENIAQNRRNVPGFAAEAGGYSARPGLVTVGTMHQAKGLEWDRVYLLAVNAYGFPAGGPEDAYRNERFYVRGQLNLLAESAEQLRLLAQGSLDEYIQGAATNAARLDLAAEKLRLLYVGITRARRELIVTWNLGRNPESKPISSSVLFRALRDLRAAGTA